MVFRRRADLVVVAGPPPRLVPKRFKDFKKPWKNFKNNVFNITFDRAFDEVINACSVIRNKNNEQTWIVEDMKTAYSKLHTSGYAHSVEAWYKGELAGGLYGVALGKCFFGESMFTRISNASKVAFVYLVEYLADISFEMIDCQVTTEHLKRFGAKEIPRRVFLEQLARSLQTPTKKGRWS